MENRKTRGEEWPYYDLANCLKNAKSSKKVFLVDRFRNDSTLNAVRLAALSQGRSSSAGFSILDYIHSIPSHIQADSYQLKDSRRQPQHYSKAPAWRHAKPELKAIFYQLAMQDAEQKSCGDLIHTSFTVNLTPEFVKEALQHKAGFIDYTKRRLDKAMKSELPRNLQYWFVVEMASASGSFTKGHQRPHIHGGILLNPLEVASARKQKTQISKAFHKAIGKCLPEFGNRLLELGNHKLYAEQKGISELEAAINWVGYCFKHNTIARLFLNSKTDLTADNDTKQQAKALYGVLTQKP